MNAENIQATIRGWFDILKAFGKNNDILIWHPIGFIMFISGCVLYVLGGFINTIGVLYEFILYEVDCFMEFCELFTWRIK